MNRVVFNTIFHLQVLSFVLFFLFSLNLKAQRGQNDDGTLGHVISIDLNKFLDLDFLDSLIAGKQIVFLGESSHYIHDFNVIKCRLVRYLHERHGFDVIAFESGIASCGLTNLVRENLTNYQVVSSSLHGIWRVKSNIDLMEYLLDNEIDLAGIDPNNTGIFLSSWYYESLFQNKKLAKDLYHLDSLRFFAYGVPKTKHFHDDDFIFRENKVDSIRNYLIKGYSKIALNINKLTSLSEKEKLILSKSIESYFYSLNTSLDKSQVDRYFITYERRDSLMAANLKFLSDTLYPDRKIIVWAHNGHVVKERIHNKYSIGHYSIGHFMQDSDKDLSFVIGISAINGYDGNNRIITPHRKSIERVFDNMKAKAVFISTPQLSKKYYFGMPYRKLNLVNYYDGIILIRDVSSAKIIYGL